ncbi:hypothetical protein ACHAXS_003856 [Conticribra weissflogii]
MPAEPKLIPVFAALLTWHATVSPFSDAFTPQIHRPARALAQSLLTYPSPVNVLPPEASFFNRDLAIIRATTDDEAEGDANEDDGSIDINSDPRLCRVRLPRAPGIEWGTDLSFSFVYVRDLEPAGAASLSGVVEKGDQICELRAVLGGDEEGEPINLIGAPFDQVMNAFASLDKNIKDIDLVFFRGTKEELKEACAGGSEPVPQTIAITVVQNKGSKDEKTSQIEAKAGCNVREVLTENGINVYQSVTRWTNCKGKQLCGTCIVNVADGTMNTNRKSIDESSTLRENPESYRLSCVTFAYGDITVETFPPIEAAQWTR